MARGIEENKEVCAPLDRQLDAGEYRECAVLSGSFANFLNGAATVVIRDGDGVQTSQTGGGDPFGRLHALVREVVGLRSVRVKVASPPSSAWPVPLGSH
jgi:hypothetical protein